MSRKRRSAKRSIAHSRRESGWEWSLLVGPTDNDPDFVTTRPLGKDWVCETRLTRDGKGWVVSSLRVFPYAPKLEFEAWADRLIRAIRFGHGEFAARLTPLVVRFARTLSGPTLPLPSGGLRSRHIRSIKLLKDVRLRAQSERGAEHVVRSLEKMLNDPGSRTRPGQRRLAKVERIRQLARVAECYVGAIEAGSRRPNVKVMEKFGLSSQKARDKVFAARRARLLTRPRKQGAPGGALTEMARAYLGDPKAMAALEPDVRKLLSETMSETE